MNTTVSGARKLTKYVYSVLKFEYTFLLVFNPIYQLADCLWYKEAEISATVRHYGQAQFSLFPRNLFPTIHFNIILK